METPLNRTAGQVISLWKGLSRARKIVLILCVLGTAVGLTSLIFWTGQPDYTLLYPNLSTEDASDITRRLKEQKIPYQIASGGSAVLVPKEYLYETRMELAAQGLPQGGGVGFEVFDRTKLGMTEFVQNVNFQRALQGELVRTINGFNEVESARVHLVMPARSLFLEREEPASASVVLKLRSGRVLSREQIAGIIHLVSSSVSGLNPENVTIVDTHGRMLSKPRDGSGLGQMSLEQLELQEKVERGVEDRVRTMLEGVLGAGKAIVRASCYMDFTQMERSSERFLPENQVVRSEQVLNVGAKADQGPTGVPGMASNSLDPSRGDVGEEDSQGQGRDLTPVSGRHQRTVNYEIGKEVSRFIDPASKVSRMSVAVVVDGHYRTVAKEPVEGEPPLEEIQYMPRPESEMEKLRELVMSAISFDEARGDRVSVVNIPFESGSGLEDVEVAGEKGWLSRVSDSSYLIKQAFLAVFILLTFLFGVRPIIKWLVRGQSGEGEVVLQLPRTVAEMEQEYGSEPKLLAYRDRAMEFITKDRDASLSVMRQWLKEEKA